MDVVFRRRPRGRDAVVNRPRPDTPGPPTDRVSCPPRAPRPIVRPVVLPPTYAAHLAAVGTVPFDREAHA